MPSLIDQQGQIQGPRGPWLPQMAMFPTVNNSVKKLFTLLMSPPKSPALDLPLVINMHISCKKFNVMNYQPDLRFQKRHMFMKGGIIGTNDSNRFHSGMPFCFIFNRHLSKTAETKTLFILEVPITVHENQI